MATNARDFIPPAIGGPARAMDVDRNQPATLIERVWPEDSLYGLPPTGYPDLETNPSLDTRRLMAEAEQIALRHWWPK